MTSEEMKWEMRARRHGLIQQKQQSSSSVRNGTGNRGNTAGPIAAGTNHDEARALEKFDCLFVAQENDRAETEKMKGDHERI